MLYNFVVFVVVMFLAGLSLWLLSVAVAPRDPHPVKEDTYECGLPAPEPIIASVNFQYYFYAIIFIAMDIAGVFFVLYSIGKGDPKFGWIFILFSLLLMIPLSYIMVGGNRR
ncbi:NADH-ubiquinone/plastoquinone oxidoreductase chain 3 [Thermovibrio ammonificans HB-1]|uniref:NADH-quinone oxidoreductase subunit n=1 Tax=Thermovibrio ammonificans (strain DSM 15698 / JCM 12110 / HB-1) TaxID=648996 RepID=E8T4K1_THEA1|nr:NADH-quinone oxidoreductase subunit A [Thermovibrio ammonificans]ADU97459.1 NADH-ubiquinone/plastoquinone oxidoreductase chain 3 [Thermovibrio ammonificans HB-1]